MSLEALPLRNLSREKTRYPAGGGSPGQMAEEFLARTLACSVQHQRLRNSPNFSPATRPPMLGWYAAFGPVGRRCPRFGRGASSAWLSYTMPRHAAAEQGHFDELNARAACSKMPTSMASSMSCPASESSKPENGAGPAGVKGGDDPPSSLEAAGRRHLTASRTFHGMDRTGMTSPPPPESAAACRRLGRLCKALFNQMLGP